MKIISYREFLELPDGVLFSKFHPKDRISSSWHEELSIKCKTYMSEGDFDNELKREPIDFGSYSLSDVNSWSRDGMFDEEGLYAIYEESDIDDIISHLERAKNIKI